MSYFLSLQVHLCDPAYILQIPVDSSLPFSYLFAGLYLSTTSSSWIKHTPNDLIMSLLSFEAFDFAVYGIAMPRN